MAELFSGGDLASYHKLVELFLADSLQLLVVLEGVPIELLRVHRG